MPFLSSTTGTYGYGRNSVVGTDIFYDQTELLLHMDGQDDQVLIFDFSSREKQVVNNFIGARIKTDQFKFGGSSGFFNNVNSYLTVTDEAAFNFSTGDWTAELFCRVNPIETDILVNKADGVGFFGYQLRIVDNRFSAKGYDNNISPNPFLAYDLGKGLGPIVQPDVWYHVAMCRQLSNFYLYVDGILVDSAVSSAVLYNSVSPLSIGGTSNGQALTSGYIDELRITKGVCRYPNGINFPVPTKRFYDKYFGPA
jgi:hypothetical protein